jgi:hypothetical protein
MKMAGCLLRLLTRLVIVIGSYAIHTLPTTITTTITLTTTTFAEAVSPHSPLGDLVCRCDELAHSRKDHDQKLRLGPVGPLQKRRLIA